MTRAWASATRRVKVDVRVSVGSVPDWPVLEVNATLHDVVAVTVNSFDGRPADERS